MSFRKILIAVEESAFSARAADEPARSCAWRDSPQYRDYRRPVKGSPFSLSLASRRSVQSQDEHAQYSVPFS